MLDGSGSSDADGDSLPFRWEIESKITHNIAPARVQNVNQLEMLWEVNGVDLVWGYGSHR